MVLSRYRTIDKVQWLVLTSICLGRYVEVICIILLLLFSRYKRFSKKIMFFFFLLTCHFFITSIFIGYPYGKFLQQISLLITISSGYYIFFNYYVESIDELWEKYLKICMIMCYIGYFQFCLFLLTGNDYISDFLGNQQMGENRLRMLGIFYEPGYFATFLIPAIAFRILNWNADTNKRDTIILTVAVLLSFTTIGYCMLSLILLYKFRNIILRYIVILIFAIFSVVGYIINYSANDEKVDSSEVDAILTKISETVEVFREEMEPAYFENGVNASTYAIISNIWVANHAPCRLTGTGLGTHEISYERLYKSDCYFYGLNKYDAYSLFIRLFSEFGYFGLIIAIVFIVKNYNRHNSINVSVLFIFIAMLIRGGHYFLYGFIFFLFCYIYTNKKNYIE